MTMFKLDPRLASDSIDCGSLELCKLLLMNDSNYIWFILVPQREGATEIHHLSDEDRALLWSESQRLSQWLEQCFDFDKLNIGALGNVVSQLHLHHVCRTQGDPAWPGPVWGFAPAEVYSKEAVVRIRALTQQAFPDLRQ
jgi:diadenosine tetraphosphate (Ap4A) HIT family hydrolase